MTVCTRCTGHHPTSMHFPRKIAAGALGRGDTVQAAASAARIPETTVAYWADTDQEFQALIQRARRRRIRRAVIGLKGMAAALRTVAGPGRKAL